MSDSENDSLAESITPPRTKRLRFSQIYSGSETDSSSDDEYSDDNDISNQDSEWCEPIGKQINFAVFTNTHGADRENAKVQSCVNVEDFYSLFITDEMFESISEQTNIHAVQMLSKNPGLLSKWVPTDKEEIKRLFGLIMWMGLVQMPAVELYWSHDPIYYQMFSHKIMSRVRFQTLSRMLYFANNETANESNHLWKVQWIVDQLNDNFKKYYNLSEYVCIDSSLIPFRGQVIYQYPKEGKHRSGIKIFKLCCRTGYTYNFNIYDDKNGDRRCTRPTEVVMNLCKDIFYKGHTLCTDKYYTSLNLASKLIEKDTHLLGMLEKNQKSNPEEIVAKKLKHQEYFAKENKRGITIMKWNARRDILMLSTRHSIEAVAVTRRSHTIKPQMIVDYNKEKLVTNSSDKMNAYTNGPLFKSMLWYKKVAFELLFNTTVLNAFLMHKEVTGSNISLLKFREKLILSLTKFENDKTPTNGKLRHQLKKKEGDAHKIRRYCTECYNTNSKMYDRKTVKNITKKVVTFCNTCQGNPHFCLNCFNKLH